MAQYGSPGGLSIPAIAQAYQNDPRTMLAQNAIKAGTSTAPVAGGKYSYLDALARALQGVTGGLIDRSTQRDYQAQQEKYNSDLKRALEAGEQPPTPPPAPDAAPPPSDGGQQAPGMAPPQGMPDAPLNAPQAAPQPQMPAPTPQGPPPGAMPSPAPQGPNPAAIAATLGAPGPQGAQAPFAGVQLPNAPVAPNVDTGPVSSRHSAIAKALLASGNPYLTQMAQEQAMSGIDDEQRQSEAAGQRRFDIAKTAYASDLDNYNSARSAAREAQYNHAQKEDDFKNTLIQDQKQHGYRLSENAAQDAAAMARAGLSANTSITIARMNELGADRRAKDQNDTALQVAGMKNGGNGKWSQAQLKGANAANAAIATNNNVSSMIDRFLAINKTSRTGGTGSFLPGMTSLRSRNDPGFAQLNQISNALAPIMRNGLPGSASDADVKMFKESAPNPNAPYQANMKSGMAIKAMIDRSNQYQRMNIAVMANPQRAPELAAKWQEYINSVPLYDDKGNTRQGNPTFEAWSNRQKFDAQGRPVK
jgi:hypothetical protein